MNTIGLVHWELNWTERGWKLMVEQASCMQRIIPIRLKTRGGHSKIFEIKTF